MQNVVLPRGYRFAGIHTGIKPDSKRLDLGLLVSEFPSAAAGVFTQNRVTAAPVKVSRERVPTPNARGVVICSGNANACTDEQGLTDARQMAAIAAGSVGCKQEHILVCSTGVIGRHLPMDKIKVGIPSAAKKLNEGPRAFHDLAEAILTTDTKVKVSSRTFAVADQEIRVTGFAK